MADIWVMGEMLVEIMRPEIDAPLNKPGVFKGPFPSGAPAIFIDTVARLGHKGGIVGGVGEDDFGRCLTDRLRLDGVDISQVKTDGALSTGCAFVTYYSDGSRRFIYHIGNTPAIDVKVPNREILKGVKYFHVMGCSLFADTNFAKKILKTAQLVKSLGGRISFDPNIRKELLRNKEAFEVAKEILNMTNVFLPGVEELLFFTGKDSVEESIGICFENQNLEMVALKNGSKGCALYTRDRVFSNGIYKVDPVDPTGAGDCFDGAFICGLLEGKTLEETIKMASAAGALNTAAFGPMEGKISKETVKEMMDREEIR